MQERVTGDNSSCKYTQMVRIQAPALMKLGGDQKVWTLGQVKAVRGDERKDEMTGLQILRQVGWDIFRC
jgi:hypothetical protein